MIVLFVILLTILTSGCTNTGTDDLSTGASGKVGQSSGPVKLYSSDYHYEDFALSDDVIAISAVGRGKNFDDDNYDRTHPLFIYHFSNSSISRLRSFSNVLGVTGSHVFFVSGTQVFEYSPEQGTKPIVTYSDSDFNKLFTPEGRSNVDFSEFFKAQGYTYHRFNDASTNSTEITGLGIVGNEMRFLEFLLISRMRDAWGADLTDPTARLVMYDRFTNQIASTETVPYNSIFKIFSNIPSNPVIRGDYLVWSEYYSSLWRIMGHNLKTNETAQISPKEGDYSYDLPAVSEKYFAYRRRDLRNNNLEIVVQSRSTQNERVITSLSDSIKKLSVSESIVAWGCSEEDKDSRRVPIKAVCFSRIA